LPGGYQQPIRIETPPTGFLGLDTASEPTSIDVARSRRLLNAYQPKLKALGKRPGSIPVVDTALPAPIKHISVYPFSSSIVAASGATLYKLVGATLTAQTMTNVLNTSDIYDVDFTNSQLANRKIIADGTSLKEYNGTTVKNVTPAADDPDPAPDNVLADVNAKGCKYIWIHNDHIFISPGTSELFYTKRYEYDYIPETQYFLLVRNGDYINGCGIPFDNVCFVPMRHGWGMISGTNFDDFDASFYLNTINGVIAPRSIQKITYATGAQTVAYLSDDGVNEIFTATTDAQGRQYATRNLMKDKLDFGAFGFTQSELAAAKSKYIVKYSMYLLQIKRDTTNYVLGYDTRNAEWYVWTNLQINSFVEFEGDVYFGSDDGLLKQFDEGLYSDWANKAKTTGTPVDFDRITGMISFEDTGYDSTLDYYILRLKTYTIKASLDVSLVHLRGAVEAQQAIQNYFMVWDVSEWDESNWANLEYTDLVASPQRLSHRLKLPKKGFYYQIRWRNNRDEPVEIYGEALIGRASGEV